MSLQRFTPLFVIACVAVLPFGRSVEVAVIAMAVMALYAAAKNHEALRKDLALRSFMAAFGLIWLATLFSLPDAINPGKSAAVAAGYIRYGLAGLLVVFYVRTSESHGWIAGATTWLLVFWAIDIYVQAIFGTDLLGFPAGEHRLNGVFGEGAPKYAIVSALLFPIALEHSRKALPLPLAVVFMVMVAGATVLAGTRSAWITLVVIFAIYAWIVWQHFGRKMLLPLVGVGIAAVIALGVAYQFSDRISTRVDAVVELLTPATDEERAANKNSVSHRYWIWQASLNMIAANPVNGVGPRGFRYAFAEHTEPGDPFFERPEPVIATHSHHVLLELLAETGIIGLLLFLSAAGLLTVFVRQAIKAGNTVVRPYAVCLIAGLFPLNTHLAFYSSFWSQLMWWLVALLVAACATSGQRSR